MKWTVSQVDQQLIKDTLVPVTAHWRCDHSDDDFAGMAYGTAALVSMSSVGTLQELLEHVWANGVSKEDTEKYCLSQIYQKRMAAQSIRLNELVSVNLPDTPLDSIKLSAVKQVDEYHSVVLQGLVGNPTQAEKDTWAMKLETASAIVDQRTVGPAGQAFLRAAGIPDTAYWAKSTLAKSAGFAAVVGIGEKLRASARQGIKDAQTPDEVYAVVAGAISAVEAVLKTSK